MTTTFKIAIIGSGNIGEGLARAWAGKKHDVTIGARNPGDAELVAMCKEIGAKAASVSEAAKGADVVAFAMPWAAHDDVLKQVGALEGKIVIDCMNAVERGPGGMQLTELPGSSSSEELQKKLPKAHVVKSFNAQGAENLRAPVYRAENGAEVKSTNFYCGDDAGAKAKVRALIEDVGFDAVDAGPLKSARLLAPMMLLWITCAQTGGSRDIAFRLLKR